MSTEWIEEGSRNKFCSKRLEAEDLSIGRQEWLETVTDRPHDLTCLKDDEDDASCGGNGNELFNKSCTLRF